MGFKRLAKSKLKKLLTNDLQGSIIDSLLKDKVVLVNADKPKKVVIVSPELFSVFDQVKSRGIQPLFIGSPVADTHDFKRARMSLAFASKAAEYNVPQVRITNKAEQLFLYTRDVWSKSIIEVKGQVKRRNMVWVFNQDNLFIGLAFAMSKELTGKGKKIVLKNVIDIGNYLRVEK